MNKNTNLRRRPTAPGRRFSQWQSTATRECYECFAARGEYHKPGCPKTE